MTIKKISFVVMIFLLSSSCMKDEELNLAFSSYEPSSIGDGLMISTPAAENMDQTALTKIYNDVYSDDNLWSMRSLLVFRNGKLVSESYLKDPQDITSRHLIWSCTKQVIGVLTGMAIEEGLISDINDPISDYFDIELENHPDKRDITIRNLITMQSGINFSNDGPQGQTDKLLRQVPDNSVEFILDLPINAEQGTEFHYNDGNPHLMSALIQKKAGKPTDKWADEVFFSQIEMSNYNWVRYRDGITFGGFGIETTPRELAKIALCVSDSGRWKGDQVINNNWIREMTSTQVQLEDSDYTFGYYWWIDPSRNIKFMWGHGGQFAFIVPSKNLLVLITSIPNTQGNYEISADEALPIVDRIIDASF